ncbi:hypothetical protein KGP24_24455 (plasmid) [Enterobacter sp. JBIWA008]|uniref:hypothetical protein n=1 Tax=Enterobacter sp. JBIWA008 TaxID=2831892 RepID=UPI001CBC44C0|nr:hypothetical protein [Enterobacter sp. JBIWA008]UAN43457.1 hypothetical protein KGP24_24455 [Enterobacter sp. JBIWA008]
MKAIQQYIGVEGCQMWHELKILNKLTLAAKKIKQVQNFPPHVKLVLYVSLDRRAGFLYRLNSWG